MAQQGELVTIRGVNFGAVSPEVLGAFVSEQYSPSRMVLAAAGYDHDELVALASKTLGKLPAGPAQTVAPSVYTGGEIRESSMDELTHFALSFKAPGWKDKDLVPICVLNADNNADLDDEQPLNEAGVVTDRMPGFGPKKMYKKAFPIPFYDHEATTEEANEALDQGHRVVAANGEHMQKDLGITLNQPNLLVYGHADTHSPHLDAAQAAYPMVDGLGDKMESKEEADAHKPLNHLIDDFKRGSEPLEAAKVNVWGQPLSKLIPSGFFDRETESMRQADGSKLKSAGIRVDRVSPFPNTAPKVGQ